MIRIAKIPNFTPAQGTVLGWAVGEIEAAVGWLQERGVKLEKYPFVQDQERGIWTTPDGNVLSVSQHP